MVVCAYGIMGAASCPGHDDDSNITVLGAVSCSEQGEDSNMHSIRAEHHILDKTMMEISLY